MNYLTSDEAVSILFGDDGGGQEVIELQNKKGG